MKYTRAAAEISAYILRENHRSVISNFLIIY